MTSLPFVLSTVALLSVVFGQDIHLILSKNTYLTECPCSPSSRGWNNGAFTQLINFRDSMDKKIKEEREKEGAVSEVIIQEIYNEASKNFKACADNHGWEECVNADSALRRGLCYPDCASFCKFDIKTWKNVGESGKLEDSCDKDPWLKSAELDKDQEPEFQAIPVPPVPATSTPSPKLPETNNSSQNGTEGTSAGEALEPSPGAGGGAINPISVRPEPGCIAVEHLIGLPKQHRKDRVSDVLCGRGFCATPNHALIVDGKWTSMRRLCASSWKCVASKKEVNNLNVFRLRRAQVGGVTITPYDFRFPRWGVFLLQALEKVLYFGVDFSLTITIAAIFVHAAFRTLESRLI